MPFPDVLHCMLCEDVRPEVHGKLSLLGFFGLTPHATIVVLPPARKVERMTFLLLCGPTKEGVSEVTAQIKHSDGTTALTFPGGRIALKKTEQFYFSFAAEHGWFSQAGTYRFVLTADGKEHYATTFRVRDGRPTDELP